MDAHTRISILVGAALLGLPSHQMTGQTPSSGLRISPESDSKVTIQAGEGGQRRSINLTWDQAPRP